MRGAPVWTQYFAISMVHDDSKQCEHVLSYYFVTVTWGCTVTYNNNIIKVNVTSSYIRYIWRFRRFKKYETVIIYIM